MSASNPCGIAVLAACLVGCTDGGTIGANFPRPAPDAFVLGETTQGEILRRYGAPLQEAIVTRAVFDTGPGGFRDLGPLTWSTYLFLPDPAAQTGVLHRKQLTFMFLNHRLVSYGFNSTFPDDRTDFDDEKRARLVLGRSTRSDAVHLLGESTSMSMYPVTGRRDLRTMGYVYLEFDPTEKVQGLKRLTLHLSPGDVVVDYEFERRSYPYQSPGLGAIPTPIPMPTPVSR